MEKRNDEKKDIEEHDEDMDDVEMESDKEGTYYRKWKAWNQGDLRKRIINEYGTGYLGLISFWYSSVFKSL